MIRRRRSQHAGITIAVLLAVLGLAAAGCGSPPPRVLADTPSPGPLGGKACGVAVRNVPGLGAPQLQRAYQAPAMLAHGINGTGTTIAVILPAAGPQITSDVRIYSQRYQLPAPDLQVIDWHAAPALDSFAAGLAAAHDPSFTAHTVMLGHSYGSLVVGAAAVRAPCRVPKRCIGG